MLVTSKSNGHELAEGTLRERIGGRPLPLRVAVNYAVEAATQLRHLHVTGVAHGAVRSSNFAIVGNGLRISPPSGLADATPQQDIYDFGLLLLEMVTGRLPQSGLETCGIPALDTILIRCWSEDPNERWQNTQKIRIDLKLLLSASPSLESPRYRVIPSAYPPRGATPPPAALPVPLQVEPPAAESPVPVSPIPAEPEARHPEVEVPLIRATDETPIEEIYHGKPDKKKNRPPCPSCGSHDTRKSLSRPFFHRILDRLARGRTYRCRLCRRQFFVRDSAYPEIPDPEV